MDMEYIMTNQGMWHVCDQIFDYLNYETLTICQEVSELWNETLKRNALVKFLLEFGDKDVDCGNFTEKMSHFIPGWNKAVKKFGAQASIEDLQEVKDSLIKLLRQDGEVFQEPVHQAAKNGFVKLFEFLFHTSYNMNTLEYHEDTDGGTVFHLACNSGKTELVKSLIKLSAKYEGRLDLNARNWYGKTTFHEACKDGKVDVAKVLIKSSTKHGIELNAKTNGGYTAFHIACGNGKPDAVKLVKLLIKSSTKYGIDLNARCKRGKTAFEWACEFGQYQRTKIVDLMIEKREEFGIDTILT